MMFWWWQYAIYELVFITFIDVYPGKERYSIRSWLTAASTKTGHNRSSSHEKGVDAGLTSLIACFGSVQIFIASDHAYYCMIEVLLIKLVL